MSLIQQAADYLFKNLGLTVKFMPWEGKDKLPFYLKDSYDFFEAKLIKLSCLLVVCNSDEELSPGKVLKHYQRLQETWEGGIVYIHHVMSPHNRKRFIQQHISFIVPGKQMYLPELAIDLREHFQKSSTMSQHFSRATQALIIYFLTIAQKGEYIPSQLAKELDYTKMTLTRAFDELKAHDIFEISREGRERTLFFSGDRQRLWGKAKPFLRTPVKKRVFIRVGKEKNNAIPKVRSGLSALAHYSSLNEEKLPTFAIDHKLFLELIQKSIIHVVKYPDEADYTLEVWHYTPSPFSESSIADPFSVYLSLQETDDERVESALEEMLDQMEWE